MRLDLALTVRDITKSRERAKKLIIGGCVSVNGVTVTKPSINVSDNDEIIAQSDDCPYVGRGGLKLETAINHFEIKLVDLVCADIGASTGGFTHCMLCNGAKLVYAIDCGHDQLDESLVEDKRVVNCEGVNVRYLPDNYFENALQFMSVDVSFISLKLIMERLIANLSDNGRIVVLIKPQFEVGISGIGKNGIVKDIKVHKRLLSDITAYFNSMGLNIIGLIPSGIKGGDGNIEYLCYMEKSYEISVSILDTNKIAENAFDQFK